MSIFAADTQENMNKYDFIIVGGGLYGATAARIFIDRGLRCLVLEKRGLVGGNIRDKWQEGINVHLYGAHIFHTSDEEVWRFVGRFAEFNSYVHTVRTRFGDRLYDMPINLSTFREVYGIESSDDIDAVLAEEHRREYYAEPRNLEEKGVNLIGRRLYDLLIKGYTEKQWGCDARKLPADIITRIPVRRNDDNRYFSDTYQGIPKEGYYKMTERMLDGIEVRTGVDFLREREHWMDMGRKVIFTGMIDELMDYSLGELPYRSLRFETESIARSDYQGQAVVNEAARNIDFTRTIEHKHFMAGNMPTTELTIITREYPQQWRRGMEAYYPVRTEESERMYNEYVKMAQKKYPQIILGGRLGLFRYLDMDDTIAAAMKSV